MKRFSKAFLVSVLSLCFFLGAFTFITGGSSFSYNENRALKTRKEMSFDVLSGKFQKDVEAIMDDQFPLRDNLTMLQSKIKLFLGRRDVNGAYICTDNSFVQKIIDSDIDFGEVKANAKKYNSLKAEMGNINLSVMPVPSAGVELASKLPKFSQMYDFESVQKTIFEKMPDAKTIDLKDTLFEKNDFYYKTDHHWNAFGAYAAYCAWCKAHAISAIDLDEFEPQKFSDEFYGSLFSKVLVKCTEPDEIYIPKIKNNISVKIEGEDAEFFDESSKEKKDKYTVFMGGNRGIVEIENHDNKDGEVLLIIKDSFVNCLVPYMIPHYSKIILIDERYGAFNIAELAKEQNVNEIAIIKEAAFF